MLTMKQERYVQNLVKGMSQREAYKDAYKCKYKDYAIDNRASELFKKGEIQVRYKELIDKANKKAEEHTIMSAIERKEWLTKVLTGEIKEKVVININAETGETKIVDAPPKLKTKMDAMDILNKMDGEYIDRLKLANDDSEKPFKVNIKVVK